MLPVDKKQLHSQHCHGKARCHRCWVLYQTLGTLKMLCCTLVLAVLIMRQCFHMASTLI